jgi:hypothetical protein
MVDAGARAAVVGVTEIAVRVTEFTLSEVEPVTELRVALMLAFPGATAVAMPEFPMVATETLSDAQVTSRVMTWFVESLNVPVAVYPSFVPAGIVRPVGVTAIEVIVALVTVRLAEAFSVPRAALIVTFPGVRPLASPFDFPMLATVVSDEVQTT